MSDSSPLELIKVVERTRSSLTKLAILDDSGSVPDPDAIDAAMKVLKRGRSETCQRIALNSTSYAQSVKLACIKRQLFRTSNGFLGLSSESLRVGDEVVIATG